jgi:hypothetical protein
MTLACLLQGKAKSETEQCIICATQTRSTVTSKGDKKYNRHPVADTNGSVGSEDEGCRTGGSFGAVELVHTPKQREDLHC